MLHGPTILTVLAELGKQPVCIRFVVRTKIVQKFLANVLEAKTPRDEFEPSSQDSLIFELFP